jgi:hypothetical protein
MQSKKNLSVEGSFTKKCRLYRRPAVFQDCNHLLDLTNSIIFVASSVKPFVSNLFSRQQVARVVQVEKIEMGVKPHDSLPAKTPKRRLVARIDQLT